MVARKLNHRAYQKEMVARKLNHRAYIRPQFPLSNLTILYLSS
jgi:hypothetical protein